MHTLLTYISSLIFWQVEESQPLLLRSEKIYAVLAVVLVIFGEPFAVYVLNSAESAAPRTLNRRKK